MDLLTALFIALLTGSGTYLIMRKNLFEVLLGLTLFSHGLNMFLMSLGGWTRDQKAPFVHGGSSSDYADPVPMALILTAIVISFGVTAFLIVLCARGYEELKTPHLGEQGKAEGEE
jgi:multisubunit Na+/H+ antiporter MnhC subunit